MGCGVSQPTEEQRRVPDPKKGWEEGFKVNKQTNKNSRRDIKPFAWQAWRFPRWEAAGVAWEQGLLGLTARLVDGQWAGLGGSDFIQPTF